MRLVEDGGTRIFVEPAALHAHEAVLHQVVEAHAVGSAQLVEPFEQCLRAELLAVDGRGHAFFKVQRQVGGLIGRVPRSHAHLQKALLVVLRLVHWVFEVEPFVAQVPNILVFRIVGFAADFQRHVMRLGIVDFLIAALDIPLAPRRNHPHIGRECLDGHLEAHLVVALARAAVADGIGVLLAGDFHQPSGDDGSGDGGSEQVLPFVLRTGLHGLESHLCQEFLRQVFHIQLAGSCLHGFFIETTELWPLAHVAQHGNYLAIVVVFPKPRDDDRSIQPAAVG